MLSRKQRFRGALNNKLCPTVLTLKYNRGLTSIVTGYSCTSLMLLEFTLCCLRSLRKYDCTQYVSHMKAFSTIQPSKAGIPGPVDSNKVNCRFRRPMMLLKVGRSKEHPVIRPQTMLSELVKLNLKRPTSQPRSTSIEDDKLGEHVVIMGTGSSSFPSSSSSPSTSLCAHRAMRSGRHRYTVPGISCGGVGANGW